MLYEDHYAKMADLLGHVEPDPFGMIFKSRFVRFHSPLGIHGLVSMDSANKLEFLAIQVLDKRKGNFRKFVSACKSRVNCICIWHVWNPILVPVLERYGFHPACQNENGEIIEGWEWKKD